MPAVFVTPTVTTEHGWHECDSVGAPETPRRTVQTTSPHFPNPRMQFDTILLLLMGLFLLLLFVVGIVSDTVAVPLLVESR